jgi:hypothetical protein
VEPAVEPAVQPVAQEADAKLSKMVDSDDESTRASAATLDQLQ